MLQFCNNALVSISLNYSFDMRESCNGGLGFGGSHTYHNNKFMVLTFEPIQLKKTLAQHSNHLSYGSGDCYSESTRRAWNWNSEKKKKNHS
jgi:hypothetical protein